MKVTEVKSNEDFIILIIEEPIKYEYMGNVEIGTISKKYEIEISKENLKKIIEECINNED